jgi:predicted phosphodiesterase
MRLQYLSDLHLEFHADDGASFVASLDAAGVDVLILAGDIAVAEQIGPALARFCAHYADAMVVYVHGNHEFYGTTRDQVVAMTRAACERHPNLRWLDGDVTEICGTRFLGAPLWFPDPGPARAPKMAMNDFHAIQGFENWVYNENARTIRFFEQHLRAGDVVVTHHLPAQACVAAPWKGSSLNAFFVCDLERLIRLRRPRLWVHGHTHESVDLVVGHTRIVCNPFGYVPRELNAGFQDSAVIEV